MPKKIYLPLSIAAVLVVIIGLYITQTQTEPLSQEEQSIRQEVETSLKDTEDLASFEEDIPEGEKDLQLIEDESAPEPDTRPNKRAEEKPVTSSPVSDIEQLEQEIGQELNASESTVQEGFTLEDDPTLENFEENLSL